MMKLSWNGVIIQRCELPQLAVRNHLPSASWAESLGAGLCLWWGLTSVSGGTILVKRSGEVLGGAQRTPPIPLERFPLAFTRPPVRLAPLENNTGLNYCNPIPLDCTQHKSELAHHRWGTSRLSQGRGYYTCFSILWGIILGSVLKSFTFTYFSTANMQKRTLHYILNKVKLKQCFFLIRCTW